MFGKRLKKLREEKELRQEDLGKVVNVEKSTVSQWESGKRTPDAETIMKLADFFGVNVDYLLGRTDVPAPIEAITAQQDSPKISFGQVIRKLREEKDWTVSHAAKILGITEEDLSKYENDELIPDTELLNKFAEAYADAANYKSPTKLAERMKQFLLSEEGSVEVSPANMLNLLSSLCSRPIIYDRTSASKNKRVPILGTIKAGLPILAEEHWEGEIEVPEYIGGDFALRVEGDSMIYAGIFPGDIAIIKSATIAQHGQVVAAGVEEEAWRANLKFFVQSNGKTLLRSANPGYKDIEFTPQHRIIGVLTGIIRDEAPTLHTYMQMIVTKDELQEEWMEVIETAMENGLGPEHVKHLIEVQGAIARKLKEQE